MHTILIDMITIDLCGTTKLKMPPASTITRNFNLFPHSIPKLRAQLLFSMGWSLFIFKLEHKNIFYHFSFMFRWRSIIWNRWGGWREVKERRKLNVRGLWFMKMDGRSTWKVLRLALCSSRKNYRNSIISVEKTSISNFTYNWPNRPMKKLSQMKLFNKKALNI